MKATGLLSLAAVASSAKAALQWAADFSSAADSNEAGFGDIQIQDGDGDITDGPPIPVIDHPKLGKALNISLGDNQMRWEAAPGAGDDLGEGQTTFFRVDFVIGDNFPFDQDNPFCLMNQVHQGSNSGSPPIELDLHDNSLWIRGASDAYNEELVPVEADTVYKLVYGVKFSTSADDSLINVWVNDRQVLKDYVPGCPMMVEGNSYWKGATMYCSVDVARPLEVYETNHMVGDTLEDVNS